MLITRNSQRLDLWAHCFYILSQPRPQDHLRGSGGKMAAKFKITGTNGPTGGLAQKNKQYTVDYFYRIKVLFAYLED